MFWSCEMRFESAEGGVRADVVTLHDDAFGLADHVAVEQGGPEVICSLSLALSGILAAVA
jgi:hypothetical protein